jgi:hypothetical protein
MRRSAIAIIALSLTGCGGPTWPADQFPEEVEVERTLFAAGGHGLRETCEAMVVELTDEAATRMLRVKKDDRGLALVPPAGWKHTPIRESALDQNYYRSAFAGCNGERGGPLGDLPGALTRTGAFYKVVNGGEGIAIIVPRAKLAGYFYFG